VKGWKKIYKANGSPKQAGIAVLISDTIGFKSKSVRRDKIGHFIKMNGTIHQKK
jgi:hypothetical protein